MKGTRLFGASFFELFFKSKTAETQLVLLAPKKSALAEGVDGCIDNSSRFIYIYVLEDTPNFYLFGELPFDYLLETSKLLLEAESLAY